MEGRWSDGDRAVELDDDGLPEQFRDDPEAGEPVHPDEEWLRDERPPHWD